MDERMTRFTAWLNGRPLRNSFILLGVAIVTLWIGACVADAFDDSTAPASTYATATRTLTEESAMRKPALALTPTATMAPAPVVNDDEPLAFTMDNLQRTALKAIRGEQLTDAETQL